jgi:hypothetical protein
MIRQLKNLNKKSPLSNQDLEAFRSKINSEDFFALLARPIMKENEKKVADAKDRLKLALPKLIDRFYDHSKDLQEKEVLEGLKKQPAYLAANSIIDRIDKYIKPIDKKRDEAFTNLNVVKTYLEKKEKEIGENQKKRDELGIKIDEETNTFKIEELQRELGQLQEEDSRLRRLRNRVSTAASDKVPELPEELKNDKEIKSLLSSPDFELKTLKAELERVRDAYYSPDLLHKYPSAYGLAQYFQQNASKFPYVISFRLIKDEKTKEWEVRSMALIHGSPKARKKDNIQIIFDEEFSDSENRNQDSKVHLKEASKTLGQPEIRTVRESLFCD